jgi:phospholipid/cholesterol/gamma-HCH transport system permease protein
VTVIGPERATAAEGPSAAWRLQPGHPENDSSVLRVSGSWTLESRPAADIVDAVAGASRGPIPGGDDHTTWAAQILEAVTDRGRGRLVLEGQRLTAWDSGLLIFLRAVMAEAARRGITVDLAELPAGVRRLLALSTSVPTRKDTAGQATTPSLLTRIGLATGRTARAGVDVLAFLGEASLSLVSLLAGKARFRRSEFFIVLQEVGAQALPIVSLITFLVGVILAYVGAVQLRTFGAQIYVADLVGIAMTREMGAMMAGIIMAGRTGAAFAAQLGTMQVNEEIDALATLGIPPLEFLVLPRILALAVMMPLLCLYADLLGMIGGGAVGLGMLDLGGMEYYLRTTEAIGIGDFVAGLIKASVFGVLVAIAGCLRGMQCGRSSAAVGAAATSAVVTGIVLIIVSDALLTVIFDLVGL